MHTREIGQLLVREIVDCSEVSRLMLIGVMAEVLKHLLQINFDFVECFDSINPVHDINTQVILNRDLSAHLGGWGGLNLTVSAVAMMSGLRCLATSNRVQIEMLVGFADL
jgi:hypothetical protein